MNKFANVVGYSERQSTQFARASISGGGLRGSIIGVPLTGGRCNDLLASWGVRGQNPDGAGHLIFSAVAVGLGGFKPPLRNSKGPPKSCKTQPDCENC